MDTKLILKLKRLLMEEKQRIFNNSQNARKNEISLSADDLPDETDLASSEISQNLVFKLRERERRLLSLIDDALQRMEDGTFGVCSDCEEPIEPKRLEARPMSVLCVSCKEKQEHKEKIYA